MISLESIPLVTDEPTTKDNPVKFYVFGWEENGKKRGYGRFFKSLQTARLMAQQHAERTGKTGHHVIGRAVAGFAF